MRRLLSLLSFTAPLVLALSVVPPSSADTGNRSNCGTHVSGVNAMSSRTGTYKVIAYPKACHSRFFNGSGYTTYMPWTKTPVVSFQGVSAGSDASFSTAPHVAKKETAGGEVTAVRYDWTVKLATAGGSTYTTWRIWVFPTSGTQISRVDPNGTVFDPKDPWD